MSEYSRQPSVWGTVGSRGSGTRTHLLFLGPQWSHLSRPAPIFCFVLSPPEFVLFIPKLNLLQPRLTGLLKMSWTSWRLQKVLVSQQVQWEKQCSISVIQICTVLCWLHIHSFISYARNLESLKERPSRICLQRHKSTTRSGLTSHQMVQKHMRR